MTDIEKKALALVNSELSKAGFIPLNEFPHGTAFYDAFYKVVEAHELDKARHAAELREQAERFSEAVTGFWNYCKTTDTPFPAALSPFILAKPDPLVVEAREICARVCEGWTDIPNGRATAYRDGVHDDEADFAYVLNALRKANERPTHD